MGDFEVISFSQTSEVRIFSPTYNGVRYFPSIIHHKYYFLSVQDIVFLRNFFACFLPFEISLQDIFF